MINIARKTITGIDIVVVNIAVIDEIVIDLVLRGLK